MQRRDVLRALGAAAALAVLPERDAIAAWAKTASGWRPRNGLTDDQLSLIGAIADTILPRTKSPSASDVKVPAFIDVIVSDQYSDRGDEAETQLLRDHGTGRLQRRDREPRRHAEH